MGKLASRSFLRAQTETGPKSAREPEPLISHCQILVCRARSQVPPLEPKTEIPEPSRDAGCNLSFYASKFRANENIGTLDWDASKHSTLAMPNFDFPHNACNVSKIMSMLRAYISMFETFIPKLLTFFRRFVFALQKTFRQFIKWS